MVAGRRRRLRGVISMDQTVVDLGSAPVPVETPVTVFGPGDDGEPTVREWAAWSGTLEHEIVTGIGARVERREVRSGVPRTRTSPSSARREGRAA
jgi:alanine racemase